MGAPRPHGHRRPAGGPRPDGLHPDGQAHHRHRRSRPATAFRTSPTTAPRPRGRAPAPAAPTPTATPSSTSTTAARRWPASAPTAAPPRRARPWSRSSTASGSTRRASTPGTAIYRFVLNAALAAGRHELTRALVRRRPAGQERQAHGRLIDGAAQPAPTGPAGRLDLAIRAAARRCSRPGRCLGPPCVRPGRERRCRRRTSGRRLRDGLEGGDRRAPLGRQVRHDHDDRVRRGCGRGEQHALRGARHPATGRPSGAAPAARRGPRGPGCGSRPGRSRAGRSGCPRSGAGARVAILASHARTTSVVRCSWPTSQSPVSHHAPICRIAGITTSSRAAASPISARASSSTERIAAGSSRFDASSTRGPAAGSGVLLVEESAHPPGRVGGRPTDRDLVAHQAQLDELDASGSGGAHRRCAIVVGSP